MIKYKIEVNNKFKNLKALKFLKKVFYIYNETIYVIDRRILVWTSYNK